MQKLLFFLLIGIVAYVIMSRVRREGQPPTTRPTPGSQAGSAEDMVRCANCAVHLPRGESFTSEGQFFCSDEHRRLGPVRSQRR